MKNLFQIIGIAAILLALLVPQSSYGQVKVGDNYQGGIPFYVDGYGQEDLVCQTRDLGSMGWANAVSRGNKLGDDWRLPSKELNLMYTNLHNQGRNNFANEYYWSSSDNGYQTSVLNQDFNNGEPNFGGKVDYIEAVRAVQEFAKKVPVSAKLSLQSGIQAGANGRNRIPLNRNDPAYTVDGLDINPAIYVYVTFSDGSTIGPHDYQTDYSDNLIIDDTSGDPNDLIKVSWWDKDSNNPSLGKYAAQLTSTGNGVGNAYLKMSLRDAPNVTASVLVEVVSSAKPVLAAPRLNSPADNKIFTHYPRETTLIWGAVSGAAKYVVELDCHYSNNTWYTDTSDEPFRSETTSDTFHNFSWVGAQAGRWRITAVDKNGNKGTVSEWRRFEYTQ